MKNDMKKLSHLEDATSMSLDDVPRGVSPGRAGNDLTGVCTETLTEKIDGSEAEPENHIEGGGSAK